jgi:3-oxoacyl-[acyl-carrier protein] reductase
LPGHILTIEVFNHQWLRPLLRVATPEDVTGAVLLGKASDHKRILTGCYIPVSGGLLML